MTNLFAIFASEDGKQLLSHLLPTSQPSEDAQLAGRIQNRDWGPWTTPWTTPNFQQEIAPVNMKIYQRSGYEQKHRL